MSIEASISADSDSSLTLEKVWNRRDYLIQRGFDLPEPVLIEALPVAGKSYGVIKWAAQTGKSLTVLAPRHDLLKEYEERCEKFGLAYKRLPSFYRDCDSFEENDDGKFDPIDDAAKKLKKDYERGLDGESLHRRYPEIPCRVDGDCPFVTQREFEPSDFNVLLGTYRHAYREKWIEGRYVAIDEFPEDAFLRKFENGIEPVVSAYLDDYEDELPFRNHRDFLRRMNDPNVQDDIEEWKESISWPYDYGHVRRSPNPSAHALAPMATLALIEEKRLDNDWGYSDLGEGRIAVCNPRDNDWIFHLPPDLSASESIVALDGTPNKKLWELTLNESLEAFSLLNEGEREVYLREVLGYSFIQTTTRWRAIQGEDGASPPKDLAFIEGVADRECQTPALISSKRAIRQYESEGLKEITDTVEHYNRLKGMNRFGTGRLGIVLGNPHPGDGEIEKWSALAGKSAKRKEVNGEPLTGNATDYGPFGNEVMHTLIHDEVLQAAMRFGRERKDGVRGATVYLHTSAIPNWLPVEKQIADIHSWLTEKNGMRDTIEAILSLEGWRDEMWKATDLYDRTSISNRHVRNRLDDLAEEGYIEYEGKWGRGTPKHYSNNYLEDAGQFGHVEFPS